MPSELEPHFEEDEEEEQEEDEDEEEEEEIETQATNHHSERYFLEGENGINGDESFYLNNEGALEVEAKSCETKEVVCPWFYFTFIKEIHGMEVNFSTYIDYVTCFVVGLHIIDGKILFHLFSSKYYKAYKLQLHVILWDLVIAMPWVDKKFTYLGLSPQK